LEDFYRGKTMSLVVSSATGGGYDALSRIVAKRMVKHMPGSPNIVVRNMPVPAASSPPTTSTTWPRATV
jgi:tripartite-type tricarboxylate transporter receptor subunit TctC